MPADQFARRVAEQTFNLRVGQADGVLFVDDQDAVGSGLDDAAKPGHGLLDALLLGGQLAGLLVQLGRLLLDGQAGLARVFEGMRQIGDFCPVNAFVEAHAVVAGQQAAGLGRHAGKWGDQSTPVEQLQAGQHGQHGDDQQAERNRVDQLRLVGEQRDSLAQARIDQVPGLVERRHDGVFGLHIIDAIDQCQGGLAVAAAHGGKGLSFQVEQLVGVVLGLRDQVQLGGCRPQCLQALDGLLAGAEGVQLALEQLPIVLVAGHRVGAYRIGQQIAAIGEQVDGGLRFVEPGNGLLALLQEVGVLKGGAEGEEGEHDDHQGDQLAAGVDAHGGTPRGLLDASS
ncbi:hypothetical protein D3C81_1139970 [compost metagenome]